MHASIASRAGQRGDSLLHLVVLRCQPSGVLSERVKGPNGYRGVNSLLKFSTTTLSKPVRQI